MANATQLGEAGLKGWRQKVGDSVAPRVAARTKLGEDQVRALVGAIFFALAVLYVAKTVATMVRELREG